MNIVKNILLAAFVIVLGAADSIADIIIKLMGGV